MFTWLADVTQQSHPKASCVASGRHTFRFQTSWKAIFRGQKEIPPPLPMNQDSSLLSEAAYRCHQTFSGDVSMILYQQAITRLIVELIRSQSLTLNSGFVRPGCLSRDSTDSHAAHVERPAFRRRRTPVVGFGGLYSAAPHQLRSTTTCEPPIPQFSQACPASPMFFCYQKPGRVAAESIG